MQTDDLLKRLEGVKSLKAHSWQAKCPNHSDDKPSLTVTETDDKILIYCHAGCSTTDILADLGLKMIDLYKTERPPETWQNWLETYKKKQIEAIYNYTDEYGVYLYSKVRLAGKEIIYGTISPDKTRFNMSVKSSRRVLYNLPGLIRTVKGGFPVYYVEGEKDADTLTKMGLTATTAGGAADWRREYARFFTGARVVILQDNDEAGHQLAEKVERDLRYYAHAVKTVTTSRKPKGDVTDYMSEGHTPKQLSELVDFEPWKYAPWINETATSKGVKYSINEGILAEAVERTLDYYIVRRKGEKSETVYIYNNGVYSESSQNSVKARIRQYMPTALVKDSILKNVYSLLMGSDNRIKPLEAFNRNENLICLKNGILDISTGKLEPHTPEKLFTIQLNASYKPDAQCPVFINTVRSLCTHNGVLDTDQEAVLQEWFGLILANIAGYRIKKALLLYSPVGNTGKTRIINALTNVLGEDNVINISVQNLSDRFAMADVYGKRLIAVGDQKGGDIEDGSVFKQITGGDALRVEPKGKAGFNYLFTGVLVMLCNTLPGFADDKGGHVFERLELMKCDNVIPPDKRDKLLDVKLMKEADGIFMWSLEGLKRLIANGYSFTASTLNAMSLEEYRGELDTLHGFIMANCEITEDYVNDRIKKSELDYNYSLWCSLNGLRGLEPKNIKKRAEKNGIKTGLYHGYPYYKGIKYKPDSPYYKGTEQQKLN